MATGNLFIISAPSGGGKTSLVSALLAQDKNLQLSVSYTTREKREGEIDGKDYFFIDHSAFQRMIDEKAFFEYATVFENYYGTAQKSLQKQLQAGYDVVLEIDWQGARQIKAVYKEAVGIFILPPSLTVLENRLRLRGQDNLKIIQARMQQAVSEISHYHEYDYIIINREFEVAVEQISAIITSSRLRVTNQVAKNAQLLHDLLV